MAEVIIYLLPKMTRFMAALAVVYYMFAVVGMKGALCEGGPHYGTVVPCRI